MGLENLRTDNPAAVAFGRSRLAALRATGMTTATQVYPTEWGTVTVRLVGGVGYIDCESEYGKYLSADAWDLPGLPMETYDWTLGGGEPVAVVRDSERNGLPYTWRNKDKTKLLTYDHGGNSRHIMLRPEEGFSLQNERLHAFFINGKYIETPRPVHGLCMFQGVVVYVTYVWNTIYNLQPVYKSIDFWAGYDGPDKPFTKFASIPVTDVNNLILNEQYRLQDHPFFSSDGSMFVIGVTTWTGSTDDGDAYPLVGKLEQDESSDEPKFTISYGVRTDDEDKPEHHASYGMSVADGRVFWDVGKDNRIVCATLYTPEKGGDMWVDDVLMRAGSDKDRYVTLRMEPDDIGDITRAPLPLHIDIRYRSYGWIEVEFERMASGTAADVRLNFATMHMKQEELLPVEHNFIRNATASDPGLITLMLSGCGDKHSIPRAIGKVACLDERSYFVGYTPVIDVLVANEGVRQFTDDVSFGNLIGATDFEFVDIQTFNASVDRQNEEPDGPYLEPFDMFDTHVRPLFALCDVRLG